MASAAPRRNAPAGGQRCHAGHVAAESAPTVDAPARLRALPPASTWVAASVALAAALVMIWTTAMVGTPLRAECLREAGAATCAGRTGWLDGARALQVVLAVVAAGLLVLTGLRRARFVRRSSVLVIVLAVGSFFVAVLMASGGVPDNLLG